MFDFSVRSKVILVVLFVLCVSAVGVADFSEDYKYGSSFSVEKVSGSVSGDVDPVEFDSLSNSERKGVLSEISGEVGIDKFDEVPNEFGREGYLSINGQLYEYESSPSVESDTSSDVGEVLISIIGLFVSAFLMTFVARDIIEEFDLEYREIVGLSVVFVLIVGIIPLSQVAVFGMTTVDTGTVTYLGPADTTEDATEFSSLSMEQQAYVATLTSRANSVDEDGEGVSVDMHTDMSREELEELDTVVMQVAGEERYYNFVTTEIDSGLFGLTLSESVLSFMFFAVYLCLCLVFVSAVSEVWDPDGSSSGE